MKIDIYSSPALFVEHGKEIEKVLRLGVREALLVHKRAGNTIAAWKDGRLQLIKAEDIIVEPVVPTE